MKKPLALLILDGFGSRPDPRGNAILAARKPNLDRLFSQNPLTTLLCSGRDVGLPDGQMGNSEVGHTIIGAGRIVYQELTRITKAIEDGDFFENPALVTAMQQARDAGTRLHIMGLTSDGGVHSHLSHLIALARMAKEQGLTRVYFHCFLDGRDVAPTSGTEFVHHLQIALEKNGVGSIATVCGRYYAMDRDQRWDRVEKAYSAMVRGEGIPASDPVAAIQASYVSGLTDEFVLPTVCDTDGLISSGDSVIFANFRPDRARELTRALVDPAFTGFARTLFPLHFVCLTQYDATMPNVSVAFLPVSLTHTLGETLSEQGLTQLRIAETEKYAHVTFFFNGGVEPPYPGEDRVLIPSPHVATYDLKPAMSAVEVTDEAVARIQSGKYDVIILNFANCDMVGHTGIFSAAVEAVETVDTCVGRIASAIEQAGGCCLITADHGNADQMLEDGLDLPFTAHTTNPVFFCAIGTGAASLENGGTLRDIAPTMLSLLHLPQPAEMTGHNLLKF